MQITPDSYYPLTPAALGLKEEIIYDCLLYKVVLGRAVWVGKLLPFGVTHSGWTREALLSVLPEV